jgi:uncharacterized RDD family membrane protein YckC
MVRRIGAWIADLIILYLLATIVLTIVYAIGGAALVMRSFGPIGFGSAQAAANSYIALLVVGGVASLALEAVYYVWSWRAAGGTPGQRLLSIKVVDGETGRNLSLVQASLRWLALSGVSTFVVTVLQGTALWVVARSVGSGAAGSSSTAAAHSSISTLAGLSNVVSTLGMVWLVALLISAIADGARRGLHDRLAGSIVVAKAQEAGRWPIYVYPPEASTHGHPPAGQPGPPLDSHSGPR